MKNRCNKLVKISARIWLRSDETFPVFRPASIFYELSINNVSKERLFLSREYETLDIGFPKKSVL